MQGRWTIGKKLFTGVGVLIALLMASGATTLWTTRAMNERLVNTGEKTVRRIRLAERAQAEPLRMYIAEQMMLLARAAGDKALHDTWKAKFDAAQAALQTELTQLDGLLDMGSSKEALGKFKQGSAAFLKAHDEVMALVALDKHFEANQMSLDKVRPTMEANEAFIRIVVDNQTKLLDEDVAQSAVAYNRANLTGLVLLGIGLSVAGLVGWVVHSVNGRLRNTAADAEAGRGAGRVGGQPGGHVVAVALAGRHRAGGVARGDLRVDGGDGLDDAQDLRERPPGGDARHRRGAAGRRVERGAGRDGHLDVGDPRVEQQGRQDHQDDRRDRLPDEHPGAQRGGRSGPRRRGRHGLRGGRRRSPQPGAALGPGGQGHRRADRGIDRPLAGRHRQGRTGRQRDRDDHPQRQPGEGHRPGSARGQPPADAGHRPGDAGHLADGEGHPDHRGDGGRERGGERGAERPGRRLDGGGARARGDGRRRGAAAGRGRRRRGRPGGGRRPDPGGHGAEAAGGAGGRHAAHGRGTDPLRRHRDLREVRRLPI